MKPGPGAISGATEELAAVYARVVQAKHGAARAEDRAYELLIAALVTACLDLDRVADASGDDDDVFLQTGYGEASPQPV